MSFVGFSPCSSWGLRWVVHPIGRGYCPSYFFEGALVCFEVFRFAVMKGICVLVEVHVEECPVSTVVRLGVIQY